MRDWSDASESLTRRQMTRLLSAFPMLGFQNTGRGQQAPIDRPRRVDRQHSQPNLATSSEIPIHTHRGPNDGGGDTLGPYEIAGPGGHSTLQHAIEALPSTGGSVYLTGKVIDNPTINKPVTVWGHGIESNGFEPPSYIDADGGDGIDIQETRPCAFYNVAVKNASTFGWRIGPSSGEGNQRVYMANCMASRGAGHGIQIINGAVYMEIDVRIDRMGKHGLFVDTGGEALNGSRINLVSTNIGRDAMHIGSPGDSSVFDGNRCNLALEGAGDWGLYMEDGSTFRGNFLTGYGIENPNQNGNGAGGLYARPKRVGANMVWFNQLESGALSHPLDKTSIGQSLIVARNVGFQFSGGIGLMDEVAATGVDQVARFGNGSTAEASEAIGLDVGEKQVVKSGVNYGGIGLVWIRNAADNEGALVSQADTEASILDHSGDNWATSETSGKTCIYVDADDDLVVKNRLAEKKVYQIFHLGVR